LNFDLASDESLFIKSSERKASVREIHLRLLNHVKQNETVFRTYFLFNKFSIILF